MRVVLSFLPALFYLIDMSSKKTPTISSEMFDQILKLVVVEHFDLEKIAEEFSVDPKSLQSKVDSARALVQKKIEERVAEFGAEEELKRIQAKKEAAFDPDDLAERLRESRQEYYEWNKLIGKLVMTELMKTVPKNGSGKVAIPLGNVEKNIRTLRTAAETLRVTRAERLISLGIREFEYEDQEEELPVLVVQKMTDESIDELRTRQTLEAGTFDVVDDLSGAEDADFTE